jgi:hypothetical protein
VLTTRRSTRPIIVTALACGLVAIMMSGPAAARPIDVRVEAPTSSLAGTTSSTPRQDLRNADNRAPVGAQDLRSPDALDAARQNEIQLALERYYSSYGEPEPLPVAEAPAPADDDAPWLPIALIAASTLTIVAASATHLRRLRIRRRRTAGAVS